jgi:hypothetical protein
MAMHLQQTKDRSRATGGPQYYFHNLTKPVKEFLRKRGACEVVLQTPYGIAASPFMAVDLDHKIEDGRIVAGKVGHDRIHQGTADQSIGEAIREWYGLRGGDFEKIEVEVAIHDDGHFIVIPTSVKMRTGKRELALEKVHAPLSFHRDYQSKRWREQIAAVRKQSAADVVWALSQMKRVVDDNTDNRAKNILECDLLRTAGAFSILGLELGAYLGTGYDCQASRFKFNSFPSYHCPVEIKKRSTGFKYQVVQYPNLPRAVVLCMQHDFVNPPSHVDFVELPVLVEYLSRQ